MPETGNARETKPLRLLLVMKYGLTIGLCLYFAQNGPTAAAATTFRTVAPGTSPGIFVATNNGLLALNLLTLETTYLTSEPANAVAVSDHLKKVYWSFGEYNNYTIMRSNFDGSAKEVIITELDTVETMAIDEQSGNVYFSQDSEIIMCNPVGKDCAVITPLPYSLAYPTDIALDSANGVMYVTGFRPGNGFIRANMDGSNATVIDDGFKYLYGITLEKGSNDLLYWTDIGHPWTDTLGVIDVNGRNKRTLIASWVRVAYNIRVDDRKVYYACGITNRITICSADKYTGKKLGTVLNVAGNLASLELFNTPV